MDPIRRFLLAIFIGVVIGNTTSIIVHAIDIFRPQHCFCQDWMVIFSGMNLCWNVVVTVMIGYDMWSLWKHYSRCYYTWYGMNGPSIEDEMAADPTRRPCPPCCPRAQLAHRAQQMDVQLAQRSQHPAQPPPRSPLPPPPPPRSQPPPRGQDYNYETIELDDF